MAFRTLEQLDAQGTAQPPRWLVDSWLRANGTSLWSGKPKAGKSTLLHQLAASVAMGRNFLGRRIQQGLACIVMLDGDFVDDARLRLQSIMGPDSSEFKRNIALDDDLKFTKPEHSHKHLRELIGDLKPALVILDTLGAYLGMESLDGYGEVRARLREVSMLAAELDCHIALSHHDKKREAASASDRANGSTAIGGGIDVLVSVSLPEEVGARQTIECKQRRYGTGYPKTQLSFDPETQRSTPFGTVAEIQQRATESRAQDLRTDIIGAIHVEGQVEHGILLSRLSGRAAAKVTMLAQLVGEGVLSVAGTGVKGNPRIYSLAAQELEAA
jgi:AAA domain